MSSPYRTAAAHPNAQKCRVRMGAMRMGKLINLNFHRMVIQGQKEHEICIKVLKIAQNISLIFQWYEIKTLCLKRLIDRSMSGITLIQLEELEVELEKHCLRSEKSFKILSWNIKCQNIIKHMENRKNMENKSLKLSETVCSQMIKFK